MQRRAIHDREAIPVTLGPATSEMRRTLGCVHGCSAGIIVVAVGLFAVPANVWAQGPLQRLGERIRARAALQAPPPVDPLPGNAAPHEPRVRAERPPLLPAVPPPALAPPPVLPSVPGLRGGSGANGQASPRAPATGNSSANYNRALRGTPSPSLPADRNLSVQPPVAVPAAEAPAGAALAPPLAAPTPTPPRARLGATVDTPRSVDGEPPRRRRGAWITEIQPQSPAAVADLRVGDLIVAVDGRVITSVRDLIDELSQYDEGDELRIDYARDNRLQSASVMLAGPDGLARQVASEPAPTTEDRSLLGGLGSMFGGLLGGQPAAGSSPAPPNTAPASQPPAAPEPPSPLQPFKGLLETLPAPPPEQP